VIGILDVAKMAANVFAVGQRARVAVGDVDREAGGDPAQVGDDAPVDHVAFFVGNRGRNRDDFPTGVNQPGGDRRGGRGRDCPGEQCGGGDRDQPDPASRAPLVPVDFLWHVAVIDRRTRPA
jgi:hypothetical protein